jgi:Uma2 family endonuclease
MFAEMIRRGVVSEKEPVYLWKGRLAERMAPNRPHVLAVMRLAELLRPLIPPTHHLQSENPIAFRFEHSVPEPDFAVVRGRFVDYRDHPTTADVSLIIEVASASLGEDRSFAADLAIERVPVYWIVNLPESVIEVYADPTDRSYTSRRVYTRGESVPVVLDGAEAGSIAVADVLP